MTFYKTKFLRDDVVFLKLYKKKNGNSNSDFVPTYYFKICSVKTGEKLGACDFRVGNNEKLYYGGHIGYNILPEHRGNMYACRAVNLLKGLARLHGFDYFYITCNPNNLPSKGTCENAGGVLQQVAKIPEYNDMYLRGEREVCIFKFDLE